MKNTYEIRIYVGRVNADSEEEANEEAIALLEELSQCNDGSELLANATPELEIVE